MVLTFKHRRLDKIELDLAPGTVVDDFVDLNDILPTVLDIAELEYPGDYPLPGESLFSQYPQKDRSWQYVEYAENNRRWISIRNRTHKYNYYYGGGFEQLFDMQNDPDETNNLLHGEVSNAVGVTHITMREKLLEHEREWGLEGYVGECDFMVGEPYQPHPQRNEAFQRFTHQITDKREIEGMNDLVSEIPLVVAKEPIVNLRELDITSWQHNLDISDMELEDMLAAHDHLRMESAQHARN